MRSLRSVIRISENSRNFRGELGGGGRTRSSSEISDGGRTGRASLLCGVADAPWGGEDSESSEIAEGDELGVMNEWL